MTVDRGALSSPQVDGFEEAAIQVEVFRYWIQENASEMGHMDQPMQTRDNGDADVLGTLADSGLISKSNDICSRGGPGGPCSLLFPYKQLRSQLICGLVHRYDL